MIAWLYLIIIVSIRCKLMIPRHWTKTVNIVNITLQQGKNIFLLDRERKLEIKRRGYDMQLISGSQTLPRHKCTKCMSSFTPMYMFALYALKNLNYNIVFLRVLLWQIKKTNKAVWILKSWDPNPFWCDASAHNLHQSISVYWIRLFITSE